MTAPSFLYSLLLASFIGTAFHFWRGGSGGKFLIFMILSWVGFFLGHLLGSSWGIKFLMIGPISGGFGTLGSIVFLIIGNWVSHLDQS